MKAYFKYVSGKFIYQSFYFLLLLLITSTNIFAASNSVTATWYDANGRNSLVADLWASEYPYWSRYQSTNSYTKFYNKGKLTNTTTMSCTSKGDIYGIFVSIGYGGFSTSGSTGGNSFFYKWTNKNQSTCYIGGSYTILGRATLGIYANDSTVIYNGTIRYANVTTWRLF